MKIENCDWRKIYLEKLFNYKCLIGNYSCENGIDRLVWSALNFSKYTFQCKQNTSHAPFSKK